MMYGNIDLGSTHYLMSKNTPVIEIESGTVLNNNLVPYGLRLKKLSYNNILDWIKDRALPITRKNADKIYQVMNLPRENSELMLMYLTHSLSINDNYWIANEKELGKLRYEEISLFRNSFNKAMYLVALKGKKDKRFQDFTITDKNISAEYTGQGNYPKCFIREQDGIYLYKESIRKKMIGEVESSVIAKVLGLNTAEYSYARIDDSIVTKTKILSDEAVNWETAASLLKYFEDNKENGCGIPQDFALKYFTMELCNMAIFDAIVLNDDRHMGNWSFEFNADTNTPIGLAPSFDYNGTFEALPGSQSLLIFDNGRRTSVLRAGRIAYRDYGTTLKLDDLYYWIDQVNFSFNKQSLKNRILYITGRKSNMNDCY